MLSLLLPIGALLTGIALMLLGTGLLNTLLALRGSLAGMSDQTLGLIGSAYFIGFFAGTLVAPGLIRRMGHIRAFAFFAAATAVCVLLHALYTHDLFWMSLRMVTGIALVGFCTVIESWLNSQAPAAHRGQIFSVYMAVNLFALAGAQLFLNLCSPLSFTLFVVAAILVMLASMPVVATRLPPPAVTDAPRMPPSRLWAAAPAAVAGALASGLAMGAFWALGAVFARRIGLAERDNALFINLTIVAGALGQWPIGRLSDTLDRRRALALIAGLAAAGGVLIALLGNFDKWVLVGCVVFGAAAFAVYPVVVAHLIDHLQQHDILPGNACLLLLHGVGAAIGPALAGALMGISGAAALPVFFALMFAPAAAFAWLQSRRAADQIVEEAAHFMLMLRTSATVLEMMSPGEDAAHGAPAQTPQPPPNHAP